MTLDTMLSCAQPISSTEMYPIEDSPVHPARTKHVQPISCDSVLCNQATDSPPLRLLRVGPDEAHLTVHGVPPAIPAKCSHVPLDQRSAYNDASEMGRLDLVLLS